MSTNTFQLSNLRRAEYQEIKREIAAERDEYAEREEDAINYH